MTFNKARRRYPYGTRIKYIGSKVFDPICLQYSWDRMHLCHMPVSNGAIGVIDRFIFDETNENVIGVEVLFNVPDECYWDTYRLDISKLYFGEDVFIRSF